MTTLKQSKLPRVRCVSCIKTNSSLIKGKNKNYNYFLEFNFKQGVSIEHKQYLGFVLVLKTIATASLKSIGIAN